MKKLAIDWLNKKVMCKCYTTHGSITHKYGYK